MAHDPIRSAAPTAQAPTGDGSGTEGRADPHGVEYVRGVAPIDCATLSAPSAQDMVALSTSRGTGGRRASGFQLLAAGTVSIVTGANQTENFGGASLPQGFGLTVEFTQITSSASVVVVWG